MKCAARYSLCTSFGTEEPDFFERPKKQKAWAINLWKETICIYFSHARKKQISMHYVPNTEPNRTEPKPTPEPMNRNRTWTDPGLYSKYYKPKPIRTEPDRNQG